MEYVSETPPGKAVFIITGSGKNSKAILTDLSKNGFVFEDWKRVSMLLLLSIFPVSQLLEPRVVTQPCPTSVGSQYRCVHKSHCGTTIEDLIKLLPRCGPGGVGVCCPVISTHSSLRCGIRYSMTPSLLSQKFDIHQDMNHFRQSVSEGQVICNETFQERKTSPLQDTSTQPSTGTSLAISPQPISSPPLDTSPKPISSPPLDTSKQPNSSPKNTKLTYRSWSVYNTDMKESAFKEIKFNSRTKRSADSVLMESNENSDNDRIRSYHTTPVTFTTYVPDDSNTENISIYIEETSGQDRDYFFYEKEFKSDIFVDSNKSIHDMIHSLGEIEFICEYLPEASEFLREKANIECPQSNLNGKNGTILASSGNLKSNGEDRNNSDLERKNPVRSRRETGKGNGTDWEGQYRSIAAYIARIMNTLHENNITLNPMDTWDIFHDVPTLPSTQQNDDNSTEHFVKPYRSYDNSAFRGTTEDSAMVSDKISGHDKIKYTVTQVLQNTTDRSDFVKVKESSSRADVLLKNSGSSFTDFLNEQTSDKVLNGNHPDNAFSTGPEQSNSQYDKDEDTLGVKVVSDAGLPQKRGHGITDEYGRGQPSISADFSLTHTEKSGFLNKDQHKFVKQEVIKSVAETPSVISENLHRVSDFLEPLDLDSFIERNSSDLKPKVSEKADSGAKFNGEANVYLTAMAFSSTRNPTNSEFKLDESVMSTLTDASVVYSNETIDTSVPKININMRNLNYYLNSTSAKGDIRSQKMSEKPHNVSDQTFATFSTRNPSNATFKSNESAISTVTDDSTEYFNEPMDTSVPELNINMRNHSYNLNSASASIDTKSRIMPENTHNVINHTVASSSTRNPSNAEFKSDESQISTTEDGPTEEFNEPIDSSVRNVSINMRNHNYNLNSAAASGDIQTRTMFENSHNVSNHTVNTSEARGVFVNGSILTEDMIPVELDVSHTPLPEKGSSTNLSTFNTHVQAHNIQLSNISEAMGDVSQATHYFRSESLISETGNLKSSDLGSKIPVKLNQPVGIITKSKNASEIYLDDFDVSSISPHVQDHFMHSSKASYEGENANKRTYHLTSDSSISEERNVKFPDIETKVYTKVNQPANTSTTNKSFSLGNDQTALGSNTTSIINVGSLDFNTSDDGNQDTSATSYESVSHFESGHDEKLQMKASDLNGNEGRSVSENPLSNKKREKLDETYTTSLNAAEETFSGHKKCLQKYIRKGAKKSKESLNDNIDQEINSTERSESNEPYTIQPFTLELHFRKKSKTLNLHRISESSIGFIEPSETPLEKDETFAELLDENQDVNHSSFQPFSNQHQEEETGHLFISSLANYASSEIAPDGKASDGPVAHVDILETNVSSVPHLVPTQQGDYSTLSPISNRRHPLNKTEKASVKYHRFRRYAIDVNTENSSSNYSNSDYYEYYPDDDDFLVSSDFYDNSSDIPRTTDTTVSTDLIPNETSRTMNTIVSTDLIKNETSRIMHTSVSTGIIENETSRKMDTSVSTGLIQNETSRTTDTSVSTGIVRNETSRTMNTSVSTGINRNETSSIVNTSVSTGLISNETSRTMVTSVSTGLIQNETSRTTDTSVSTGIVRNETSRTMNTSVSTGINRNETSSIVNTSVSTGLISNETSRTMDTSVSTGVITNETSRTIGVSVSVGLIPNETSRTIETNASTGLIPNETSRKMDTSVSTGLNQNETSRTMDTSVSTGIIRNETSITMGTSVSTDLIPNETSRTIDTSISTGVIPNETSRTIGVSVPVDLIPNETSRTIGVSVPVDLIPNETSRTIEANVSAGLNPNETSRTADTNVSAGLNPNETSRTADTNVSTDFIPNKTNFVSQTQEVNLDTNPSAAQVTAGEVKEFYEASTDLKFLFKNEDLGSEIGIGHTSSSLDERFDVSNPDYGKKEGNEHFIPPFVATQGTMPGRARTTMPEPEKTTTFETMKDLNTDETSIDTDKITEKQIFEKETQEFDEVVAYDKTYQTPNLITSEGIDYNYERSFDLSEVTSNKFSDHVEHHTKCKHAIVPKTISAPPVDCAYSDKDCSNKLQDLSNTHVDRHESRDYDMLPVLNPRYRILNPYRFSRPTNKPNGAKFAKTKKSLTLRIIYRTPQKVLEPVDMKKFEKYRFSPENDELEKKIHLAYRDNLFKKGSFAVLHLNKHVVVYNPGNPDRLRRREAEPEEMTDRRKDPQHIIGGRMEDQPWPWVVAIHVHPTMQFVCAGTLIDDRHVVTAAHCFIKFSPTTHYTVLIGNLRRLKTGETSTDPLHRVKQLFVHEGFSEDCYCNDIAILKLQENLGPEYTPACLPQYDPAGPGDNTTILGWGDTSFKPNGKRGTTTLQRLDDLTITDSNECRKIMSMISGLDLPSNFGLYYICAGIPAGGKDACAGDSGGPLMHEDYDGIWSLIGVVSFGYKCGEPGIPGTYSRITYYLPWIIKVIAKN